MKFHELEITHIEKTIRDAVVLTLKPGEPGAFSFIQGQYLTFRRKFDGEELRRTYSICSSPDEGILQVGIKRVDGGTFSTWANTELKPGDELEALPPMGQFHMAIEPASSRHYLLFAGGSGITPILSILKTVLARESLSRVTLVYANRSVSTIMFRDVLEDLKNRHMSRLSIVHVLGQDAQDVELLQGRIDQEKCVKLFAHLIHLDDIDQVFICGPEPMMATIRDSLQSQGFNPDRIKIELFKGVQTGRAKTRAQSQITDLSAAGITARAILGGESRDFEMGRDTCLLQAALDHDVDAPYACRAGVCSTCRAKLLEGEVEMAANHALEDYEVRRGYILTCQSYPVTDKVVYDYDQ